MYILYTFYILFHDKYSSVAIRTFSLNKLVLVRFIMVRRSPLRCSIKKVFLLTGNYLGQSLFFNKVAGLRSTTLLKNRPWHMCFPVNLRNFQEHLFSQNTSGSPPKVFLAKGVLRICSKFTGEHPCRDAIPIKLQSSFIQIALWHGCSPVNLLYVFRTLFPQNTSGGLPLCMIFL